MVQKLALGCRLGDGLTSHASCRAAGGVEAGPFPFTDVGLSREAWRRGRGGRLRMASGLGRRQGSPIRPHTQRAGGPGTAAPRTHPPGVNHGSWAGPVSGGPRHREILGGAMTQMANTIHDRLVRRSCPREPCKLTASSPRPCLLGANPTDLDCLTIADGRDSGVLTAQEFTMRLLGQPGQPSLGLSPTTTTDRESIDKDWRCRVGKGAQHRRRTDSRTKTQQRSRQPTPTRAPQFSGAWGSTLAFQHLPSAPLSH